MTWIAFVDLLPRERAVNEHIKWLREAAKHMFADGHIAWANTCEQAADAFESACLPVEGRTESPCDRPVSSGRCAHCGWLIGNHKATQADGGGVKSE